MRRITKLLAAVAVVGGLGAFAGTASAKDGPWGRSIPVVPVVPAPHHARVVDNDYIVLVHYPLRGWVFHGKYETLHQARQVESRLERFGRRAKIETVRDYRGPRHW